VKSYDVAIVGGGIIGASVAWELARAGRRVVLLDRQQPGMEASWAAAGMLAPGAETPDSVPVAPLGRASLALYPEFVVAIEDDSGLRTEYMPGDALQAFFGEGAERERSEFLHVHRGLGLAGEEIAWQEALRIEPALGAGQKRIANLRSQITHGEAVKIGKAAQGRPILLRMKNEGRVEPRALMAAALAAAQKRGVELRAGEAVTGVTVAGGRACGVRTERATIAAGCVVIAAGCWSGGLAELGRYAPTRPVRGQMVALRSPCVSLRRVLRSHSGYIVPRADGRLICGSTAEPEAGFEKRVTPEGQRKILDAAVELVPALADAEVIETWCGLRPDTPDHLPSLGPTDVQGLYMATGHYRNGILLAPITARLIREWIVDGTAKSFAVEPFSPLRFIA
jgi:glycine oxidase